MTPRSRKRSSITAFTLLIILMTLFILTNTHANSVYAQDIPPDRPSKTETPTPPTGCAPDCPTQSTPETTAETEISAPTLSPSPAGCFVISNSIANTNVRKSADINSAILGTIKYNETWHEVKAKADDSDGNTWYFIEYQQSPSKAEGWVRSDVVQISIAGCGHRISNCSDILPGDIAQLPVYLFDSACPELQSILSGMSGPSHFSNIIRLAECDDNFGLLIWMTTYMSRIAPKNWSKLNTMLNPTGEEDIQGICTNGETIRSKPPFPYLPPPPTPTDPPSSSSGSSPTQTQSPTSQATQQPPDGGTNGNGSGNTDSTPYSEHFLGGYIKHQNGQDRLFIETGTSTIEVDTGVSGNISHPLVFGDIVYYLVKGQDGIVLRRTNTGTDPDHSFDFQVGEGFEVADEPFGISPDQTFAYIALKPLTLESSTGIYKLHLDDGITEQFITDVHSLTFSRDNKFVAFIQKDILYASRIEGFRPKSIPTECPTISQPTFDSFDGQPAPYYPLYFICGDEGIHVYYEGLQNSKRLGPDKLTSPIKAFYLLPAKVIVFNDGVETSAMTLDDNWQVVKIEQNPAMDTLG